MAALGGTTIQSSIDLHGKYLYQFEVLGTNGNGESILSNYATITWTFEAMALSDFEWICDTLLSGANSVRFTSSNSLYDDHGDIITPSNVIANRPAYAYASGGYAYEVNWVLERVR